MTAAKSGKYTGKLVEGMRDAAAAVEAMVADMQNQIAETVQRISEEASALRENGREEKRLQEETRALSAQLDKTQQVSVFILVHRQEE